MRGMHVLVKVIGAVTAGWSVYNAYAYSPGLGLAVSVGFLIIWLAPE